MAYPKTLPTPIGDTVQGTVIIDSNYETALGLAAELAAKLGVDGSTVKDSLDAKLRVRDALTAPTAAAGANAGSGPPAPVVAATSTDGRGNLTVGTGTGAAAGELFTVTFNKSYTETLAPTVLVQAANTAATNTVIGQIGVVPAGSAGAWTGFAVRVTGTPTSSQGNTVYAFQWFVVG